MRLAARIWEPSVVAGADAPVALLLHGITGSSGTWWRIGPALAAEGRRVIALDLPGHGDSPRMGRPLKASDWAHAVIETLDELLAERRVDLAIGHSAGGAALLEAAALDAGRFARIVLEDPPGAGDSSRPDWAAQLEQEVRAARRDPERVHRLLLRQNPTWQERDGAEAVAALQASEIEIIAEMERLGMGYRVVERLAEVDLPILLLLADEARSALAGGARAAALAGAPPSVTVATFDAGHAIHRDAFEAYLAAIRSFTR